MVQPDKRLLWHPRHENKFVVGGNSQIALYEWAAEYPEIRHVTSQHDLHFMKIPHLTTSSQSASAPERSTLYGSKQGKQAQRKGVLSSGPSVTLPVRNSRSCNALAFSDADPNYLAVGLDKVRGDSSLIIWDIATLLPALRVPLARHDASTSTDLSASVASLLQSQTRPGPSIPKLENQTRIDPRILQQHAPTEIVSSLSFLPNSTHMLAAGISHRWLRLFDLRSPASAIPALNVASKVQGIATDPFDDSMHRIACFGDSVVSVWDARRLGQPLVMFSERDAAADGARVKPGSLVTNVEFSSTRRGVLATLEKDAAYVRFWDILEAKVSASSEGSVVGTTASDGEVKGAREHRANTRRSWAANLPWPASSTAGNFEKQSPNELAQNEGQSQHTFVLADTRRTKFFSRPLSSFALVPGPSHSLTSNVMVVNKEGDLELYAIHDTPKQITWSSRGDLAFGAGVGMKILEGYADPELEDDFDDNGRVSMERDGRSAGGTRGRGGHHTYSSTSRSGSGSGPSRSLSRIRGRSGQPPMPLASPPPLFGRGDEEGFPALGVPTGLAATKPGRQRQFSPSSVRKLRRSDERGEPAALRVGKRRSPSRTDTVPADEDVDEGHGLGDSLRNVSRVRSRSKPRERVKKIGVISVVQDDISMVMRRRAKAGYGLSQPHHNITVTRDAYDAWDGTTQTLSELWSWIYHSQEVFTVPTARLHGYDFSYQGLLGIWEGFSPISVVQASYMAELDALTPIPRSLLLEVPTNGLGHIHSAITPSASGAGVAPSLSTLADPTSVTTRRSRSPADELHGNWPAALAALAARRGTYKSAWKPPVASAKLIQRQVALQVCGWSLREDELAAAIKRWEKEGKLSRAACWLVFTKQYAKAIELLMRSPDESHQMMSGTVAALAPTLSSSSRSTLELRELYGRLIIKLNDPYFRVLLTHLSTNEWSEVLDEEVIPFRERLAIAFQFLDDKTLSAYLRRTIEQACEHGSIEVLILTGLTPTGMRIIQSYVDHTGDIQSAAILSSYVCPTRFRDRRAERWLEAYRDLLDGFKLHHLRVGFDIERGQILNEAIQSGDMPPLVMEEWAPRQILIRCHYCNKPVNAQGGGPRMMLGQQSKPTQCNNCSRELPRCSVCLMTLAIVPDSARDADLGYAHHRDTFDDAIVICQTCRHGGHAVHILEWFLGEDGHRTHSICPVADCNCSCADEF